MNDHEILNVLDLCQRYVNCQLAVEQHIKDGLYQLAVSRRSSSVTLGTMFTRSVENCRFELDPLHMVQLNDKNDGFGCLFRLLECSGNQETKEILSTDSFDSADLNSGDHSLPNLEVLPEKAIKELLNEMVVVVSGSGLPPKGMKNAQDNFVLALNEIIHLANLKNSIIGTNTS